MSFSEEQRNYLQATMDAAGVQAKHLVLGLDHRTPTLVDVVSGIEWSIADGEGRTFSRVAETELEGFRVSTVFIPTFVMSHGASDLHIKKPFETMVFGVDDEVTSKRYATWTEAEEGHLKFVENLQARISQAPEM